jgi:uncharacterized membrane protein YedE/YeeE
MKSIAAFLCGLIFGSGLIVSGMTQPAKVIGFLDVAGRWDPSLAVVMAAAVPVAAVGFWWTQRRGTPMLGGNNELPPRTPIDLALIFGAALFGIGWGLGGFCPGPAWVGTAGLSGDAAVFLASMVAAMVLVNLVERRRLRAAKSP